MAAGEATRIEIQTVQAGDVTQISVTGEIPAGAGQAVRTVQVRAPASFARTLFIEALQRNGVMVDAAPLGANPAALLPARDIVAGLPQVANLVSPPLSENVKLVLKVSMNLHSDTLLPLIALAGGTVPTFADGPFLEGLQVEKAFLTGAGIDAAGISLADGRGASKRTW